MFDLERWRQIADVLKSNKLRTILTAFGVFWGVFMLMIMLGAGNGLRNGVTHGLKDFATNSMFLWTQRTTVAHDGFAKGRRFSYKTQDIKALQDRVPGAAIVAPKVGMGGYSNNQDNVVHKLNSGAFQISGDYPAFNKIDPVVTIKGRFINNSDLENSRKVAAIGKRVKEELFDPNEEVIGSYIRVSGVYFQVIGFFKPLNPNINFGGDKNRTVVVPFSSFQQAFNYGEQVDMIGVTAEKGIKVSDIEDDVVRVLKDQHHVAPEDDQAIGYFNLENQFQKISGLFTGIGILIWVVGSGTLLAGIIGVSNIMLIVVKERTREIGIQRAIGAPPKSIIYQILLEAFVLTFISGYLGLVAGTGVIEAVNMVMQQGGAEGAMFRNPEIDFGIAVMSIFILSLFGVVAGILPAKRALQIKPIQAIHEE